MGNGGETGIKGTRDKGKRRHSKTREKGNRETGKLVIKRYRDTII